MVVVGVHDKAVFLPLSPGTEIILVPEIVSILVHAFE